MSEEGLKLKETRNLFRISARKLAHTLGVDMSTVYSWERGSHEIPEHMQNKIIVFFQSLGPPSAIGPAGYRKRRSPEVVALAEALEKADKRIEALEEERKFLLSEIAKVREDVSALAERRGERVAIKPEVINAEKDGRRYRELTQQRLTGW